MRWAGRVAWMCSLCPLIQHNLTLNHSLCSSHIIFPVHYFYYYYYFVIYTYYYLYFVKSRRMRWAGRVARMMEKRNAYRLLVGKPEGKRPLWRPRRRWVENIRMDIFELERGHIVWIGLTQDMNRWRGFCEFGIESSGSIKCLEITECPDNWWPLE
jgi:hypothetical protein